jgi:hypothetical protein
MRLGALSLLPLLASLALAACGDGSDGSSTGAGGTGGAGDATTTTTSTTGTSTTATTSSSSSSSSSSTSSTGGGGEGGAGGGVPLDGYGALSGTCGEIDLEDLLSDQPQTVDNEIDFTNRPAFDEMLLSAGSLEMIADGNLGGSSLYSEVFAYEVLHRCEGAELLKTEGEINYTGPGKRTDILLEIDGERVGVSVVRAMSFPEGAPYPVDQALGVLEGRLDDILQSSALVAPEDAWPKQILAVVAQTPDHAAAIASAYGMIDPATKADTIVYVTVTEGDDAFIYYNQ